MSEAGSKRVIAILTVALVLSLSVSGLMVGSFISGDFRLLDWLGFGSSGDSSGDGEGGLKIDTNAGDYVVPVVDSKVEPNVAIPGWGRITLPANREYVTVNFHNPKENEGLYYLTFELRLLTDDGSYLSLNTTPPVYPGEYFTDIKLNQTLSPRPKYDAVIHVQPYRISDGTPTNNANMKTTLMVI